MKRNLVVPTRSSKTTKAPKTARKAKRTAQTGAAPETPDSRAPRPLEIAQMLGVQLTRRLTANQVRQLKKALPGYVSVLDDAARQLTEDADVLGLSDVTPDELLAMQEEQKYLASREAAVEMVYRAVYEQRLRVDDRALGMLQKISRRVNALAEDDPNLLARWKFMRDYLGNFYVGSPGRAEQGTSDPKGGPSPGTSA